jgi:SAM-dependent methyltransferase
MQSKMRFLLLLFLAFICGNVTAQLPSLYETRAEHDPNGTGIFYMGREIAQVMGHQGADWLERPEREIEENVELMVDLLQLKPGDVVADIGAGTGYIARKMAKRVGDKGIVYAVEIQQEMLDILTNKAVQAGITNIRPALGTVRDAGLPSGSIDLALMVDVYHEFDHPYEMVQSMVRALKPGGRIVFVEYRLEDPNVPIKLVHKMSEAQVRYEASVHTLVWKETINKLPRQHIIVFQKPLGTDRAKERGLPSLEEALAANRDLWGDAAMKLTNGPTYEFFRDLIPPLRYCNAIFKHYPIVLSAPGATNKARFVSNGSAVNAKAILHHVWRDAGTPVHFFVGDDAQHPFGKDIEALKGPTYENGYLPIVRVGYEHANVTYSQQAFASTDPALSQHGVVFVQFRVQSGASGTITARIDATNSIVFTDNAVRTTTGSTWVVTDGSWEWNQENRTLSVSLMKNENATIAIATKPIDRTAELFSRATFASEKKKCLNTWQTLLARGTQIETPEPYVNDAWRSLVVGIFQLLKGDAPNYSAGNQYERLYEGECGDTTRAALLFGHLDDGKRMVVPLLDYSRKGLYFHQAAFKLQLLAHYYWLTRDTNFVREMEPRWSKEVKLIIDGREADSGLLPKEQYAGDIFEHVYSMNSNANGSKGLRDIAAVLADMGDTAESQRIAGIANALRKATLAAVEKSVVTNVSPPFIPIAMFGYEKPYEHIPATKLGSYWNEMIPYVLCSEVFGLGSKRETDMLNYQYEHGGLFMGMIRFDQNSGLYANEDGVDDLYGLRHTEKCLQRDEVDRALVSFYGKLAHGMTRDTFIGAEGTSMRSFDEFGRPMYMPPNSTANAFFLWMLRSLLVHDMDSNDDCKPDTLRLLFSTPKHWLENGKKIKVERAPTTFGEVSVTMTSRLNDGEVIATVVPPTRHPPTRTLLRARVPDGWRVESATIDGKKFKPDAEGTIDVSKVKGEFTARFKVKKV